MGRVDRMEQDKRHIIESITEMNTIVGRQQNRIEQLKTLFDQTANALFKTDYENSLISIGQLLVVESHKQVHALENLIEGITWGLEGTLSPKLVEPESLINATKGLKVKANSRGFQLMNTVTEHLFELPCSGLVHKDSVDLLLHIPLVDPSKALIRQELINIPMKVETDISEDTKQLPELPPDSPFVTYTAHKKQFTYTITPEPINLLTGLEGDRYEVTNDELEECFQLQGDFYCNHALYKTANKVSSCVVALFTKDFRLIRKLCTLRVYEDVERAVQLDRYTFAISGPKTEVIITCEDGKQRTTEKRTLNQTTIIRLPNGKKCKGNTLKHRFDSDPYDAEVVLPTTSNFEINFQKLLGLKTAEYAHFVMTVKSGLTDFLTTGKTMDTIARNVRESMLEAGRYNYLSNWLYAGSMALAALTAIGFVGFLIYIVTEKQRRKKFKREGTEKVRSAAKDAGCFPEDTRESDDIENRNDFVGLNQIRPIEPRINEDIRYNERRIFGNNFSRLFQRPRGFTRPIFERTHRDTRQNNIRMQDIDRIARQEQGRGEISFTPQLNSSFREPTSLTNENFDADSGCQFENPQETTFSRLDPSFGWNANDSFRRNTKLTRSLNDRDSKHQRERNAQKKNIRDTMTNEEIASSSGSLRRNNPRITTVGADPRPETFRNVQTQEHYL